MLAIDSQTPVGFASFSSIEKNEKIYRLHTIYVLPQQQEPHRANVIEYVIICGYQGPVRKLDVNRHNKARHFYKKHGFVIIREGNIDIRGAILRTIM
jgi:hypothetical protein